MWGRKQQARADEPQAQRRSKLTRSDLLAITAIIISISGGGVAYAAVKLPRNSVGAAQIRPSAVGSREIKNHSIVSADISTPTLKKLRGAKGDAGPQGPAGPAGPATVSYFAAVNGAGQIVRPANPGVTGAHTAINSGSYTVGFPTSVSNCAYSVTLGGFDATSAPPGYATVRDDGGKVGVQLYDTAGNPVDRSFYLIVAC
ncbi:hypothetical protein [Conexibacter woesei]|uniref:hypothetical protein n=1 Tax=Conexibacter woesei TaxID=191495 RepID=UPI0004298825|nr:hypothetical protein [Conexibacter woesei]